MSETTSKEHLDQDPLKENIDLQGSDVEIQKLKEEIEEHKQKYIRSLAELENTRKRMQKERQEMTKFAVENVISDFLSPLDNFEKALGFTSQMSDETRNWAMGFKMILTQLQDILTEHGIHSFESVGKEFNPHLHEAVSVEETEEYKDGYILEEFAKGYKSSDRTIRPARVKVAKHPKKESDETSLEPKDLENK
jgi:molecular chaperone GrpE